MTKIDEMSEAEAAIRQEKSEKRTSFYKHKLFAFQFTLLDVAKQKEIVCRAVDTSYQKAKQKAAIKSLNQNENKRQIPKNLIGFPNYRGHCYFIPVFLPLFWNANFVDALIKATEIASACKSKFRIFYCIKGLFEAYRKASMDETFQSLMFLMNLLSNIYCILELKRLCYSRYFENEDDFPNEMNIGLPDNLNVFGPAYEKYAYSPLRHNRAQSGDRYSIGHCVLMIKHEGNWK
uniref:Uncharacterized protein n=1 Tax=Tetranychus urticae TaxID=32264 RepID=A0A158P557_TETUR